MNAEREVHLAQNLVLLIDQELRRGTKCRFNGLQGFQASIEHDAIEHRLARRLVLAA